MSQAVAGSDIRGEPIQRDPVLGYFQRSELPFASLLFVLPMIVLYELGTRFVVSQPGSGGETRIIAFTLMREFFSLFGATGRYLPCLAVVGILLSWHIARNDGWRVRWMTLCGMLVESVVLALPILGLSYAVTRYIPPLAGGVGSNDPLTLLVLSLGAGVYEEAVFRLGAITLLNLILVDAAKINRFLAFPAMVGLSALLFSGYHYLGSEPFHTQTFVFRMAAGLYFGGLFVLRGFGITAGCHAIYDVFVVLLPLVMSR
jgi:hypothetical protein